MGAVWREWTEMYAQRSYNFEVNLGHRCNMRCKFCFEQGSGYTSLAASKLDLSYFAGYMRYVHEKTGLPVTATIYGGEPFVHTDTLVPFVLELAEFADGVSVVSNGLNTPQYEDEIDQMQEALRGRLMLSVSYNFTLQDETRQAGTYERVRDSIRWLCSKGYRVNSPVVFTPDNIHRIGEVFDDFMALRGDTGGRNRLTYNYFVPRGVPFSVVNEAVLRSECARIRDAIFAPGSTIRHEEFRYSMIGRRRGDHRRDCLFAAVRAALGPDGCIYPGYDVPHDPDFIKDLLRFGRVGDPFEALDKRREELLRLLPVDPPLQCRDCHSQCRVIPWRTLKDDVSQYNQMPNPDRCKVVQIIGGYLPVSGVLHG